MESTLEHPFGFFDYYLTRGIYESLNSFYGEGIENLGEIYRVDKLQQIIEVRERNGLVTYSFAEQAKREFNTEINKSRRIIEYQFQKAYVNNQEQKYGDFLRIKLGELLRLSSIEEFPFLKPLLQTLLLTIDRFSRSQNLVLAEESSSFTFLAETENIQKRKVKKLYDLLTDGGFIRSSRTEFIKAFIGKPIKEKVMWLIKTRRKKQEEPHKASLLYLLTELTAKGFLTPKSNPGLHHQIYYVFVDFTGKSLQNLYSSHQQLSSNPKSKDDIDQILEKLK